ncbi:hypothetical protein DMI66_27105 [Escherichia coli]|nr:hypothetical protein [Escherichia coli]
MRNRQNVRGIQCVDSGSPVSAGERTERCSDTKAPPKGIVAEKGDSRPAGFTAGGNSREAVIRFPKETGQKPVYVSVTDVLTRHR